MAITHALNGPIDQLALILLPTDDFDPFGPRSESSSESQRSAAGDSPRVSGVPPIVYGAAHASRSRGCQGLLELRSSKK